MANRYWVASFAGTWNDTFNWSTTSGGIGGASVPGASDTAIFDGNGIGKCTLDMNVTVDYLDLTSGYTGAGADDGHFDSGGFDVTITSSSSVAFQNKTVTFDDGTPTTWTFGQGFSPRSSSASFTSMTACTWRFTGTGTVDSPSSKTSIHKILIENGANIRSDWGFYSRNFELRGRLRVSINYPGVYIDGAGTSEVRITSTGVLECRTTHGGGFSCQSDNASSVLNLYVDGSFDDPGNNERFRNNSGFQFQAGTVNIYATAPIDCTYQMRTVDNVNGNVHKLQQNTTFNRLRVDHHWSRTITFDQNNYDVTFGGEVAFYEAGKPTAWIPGTGSVILAPSGSADINFDGKTIGPLIVSDNAAGTATLQANVTTPYVHDCGNLIDENGYTVTTTGSDPSPCSTGNRFWVGLVDSDYENSGNWSTSSGGSGGASVPVGSNNVVFDSSSSVNCTMSASRSMESLMLTSYAGTFSAGSHSVRVANNVTASGSTTIFDLGSSNWIVGGAYNLRFISASSSEGTSTLRMTSTTLVGWLWKTSGGAFYSITLAPNAQVYQGRALSITGSFTLESGATWAAGVYGPAIQPNASLTLGNNSAITTTTGYVELRPDGTGTRTGSPTASVGSFRTTSGAGNPHTPWTIPVATYTGDFLFRQNDSTYGGIWRFEGNTVIEGNVSTSMGKGTNETIDTATNNVSLTFKGDVDITPSQGSITWSAGDGTIIFDNSGSQSVNFNGQTVEGIHVTDASTGSIVLASDFSTAWLRDCDSLIDLNGYTITNADSVDRCVYPYDPPTTIALDSSAAINVDQQLWLPMLEVSGTTTPDLSGNSNDGTLDAGLSHTVTTLGGAISFPENGGIDSSATISSQPYSVSLWGYMNSATTYYYQMFIGQTSGSRPTIYINNSSLLKMYGGSNTLSSTTTIGVGEWFHVVGVFDGSSSALYVNGAVEASGAVGPYDLSGGMRIGHWWTGGRDFDGNMQNVRVWSRALSSSEVSSLYSDPWIGSDYTAVVPPSNRFFSPATFARLG